MTRVTAQPGICGFTVDIIAQKGENRSVRLTVETECDMVKKMAEEIPPMDVRAFFTAHLTNPVYRAASKHIKHIACPVPSAILKAIEAELGLALPKDAIITFHREP